MLACDSSDPLIAMDEFFFWNFQRPDDDKDKIIMKRMDTILTVSQT
jgi:hypothetical protein